MQTLELTTALQEFITLTVSANPVQSHLVLARISNEENKVAVHSIHQIQLCSEAYLLFRENTIILMHSKHVVHSTEWWDFN